MSETGEISLTCMNVDISVPGRSLVRQLNLRITGGEFLAVLGPNGVGKSLSLHALAGLRDPDDGQIELDGQPISGLSRQQIAARLTLLPQYTEDVFPATVIDTVMIGRHPHIGRFQWESDLDREIACAALREVDLNDMAHRDIGTLSGGERRRLAVAQVLTQDPAIYLLDEPTNHLDPQHQLDVLRIFKEKARRGAAIVASLHDVNLAARFADKCLLLYGDGRWVLGDTDTVLTTERLTELYATSMESVSWRNTNLFVAAG
ncbi:MAG: ABC transporter ATP-binding protein [Gammaproteobacteria bacterium]|nr:MAG: ABC transporter ATP-binding protein [Gammaproteobacteria bacterium]